jgi:protein-disulfide isomerase
MAARPMLLKEKLVNTLLTALIICVSLTTAVVVKRQWGGVSAPRPLTARDSGPVDNWHQLVSAGQRNGPDPASITIVEFSDFQCPFCAQLSGVLQKLRAKYPTQLATIYRHYPLRSIHAQAYAAALAAECAADQGRFQPYHDELFARQHDLEDSSWLAIASKTGVADLGEFQHCIGNAAGSAAARVARDMRAGDDLRVSGTPTVVLDSVRLGGSLSFEALDSLVRASAKR